MYRIFETNQFIKQFKKLQGRNKKTIEVKLSRIVYPQLRKEPYFGRNIKKLVNWNPETWRYRIGNYRVFYEINETEKIVSIVTIYTRDKSY